VHGHLIGQMLPLVLQFLKALPKTPDPRLELVLRDDLVGVAVDQTLEAAAQLGDLPSTEARSGRSGESAWT
jgi:hypothetical protein